MFNKVGVKMGYWSTFFMGLSRRKPGFNPPQDYQICKIELTYKTVLHKLSA
jgi:hypothetical protein